MLPKKDHIQPDIFGGITAPARLMENPMKAFFSSLIFVLLASALFAAGPVQVDFTQEAGQVKPLHGIDNSPLTHGQVLPELRDAGIPYSRLHDTMGRFGGGVYVDIPNIFPNFDADPDDPASYDFTFTDAYLSGLVKSGVEPFYRLGVTIENYHEIKAYRIYPPKDPQKFAKICEMMIRHFNEGWADGHHFGIRYWEIWNEPENPPMWKGTKEQFFELYRVTANHLKKCFPDLKIGGYASCGFYPLTRAESAKPGHWHWSFIDWFETFLDYVQAEETRAPLDFFSWHLYTSDPEEIVAHSKYVDEKLKAHGMENVENIFNEWNYITGRPDQFDEMKEAPGAAFVASAFCLMQYQTGIDKAMYYDAYPQRAYCGLYYFPSRKVTKTYWSFYAFNVLYKLGTAVPVTTDQAAKIYALAAKNEAGDAAILVVNNSDDAAEVPLEIKGADFAGAEVKLLDQEHSFTVMPEIWKDGKLALPAKSVAVLFRAAPQDVPADEKAAESKEGDEASAPGTRICGPGPVKPGLEWLARHQLPNGSWNFNHCLVGDGCNCGNPGQLIKCTNAATAMGILPFLGCGAAYIQEGEYQQQVRKGLTYLVASMTKDPRCEDGGSLRQAEGTMYAHGLAAICLTEAYAMTKEKSLQDPAQKAINFITYAQDPVGGGWRYIPRQPGDTSVSGWQLTALKSACLGELTVDPIVPARAMNFLNSVQKENGAKYGYTTPGEYPGCTAIALLDRMYYDGWDPENPMLKKGVEYISSMGPSRDMYYNYYATLLLRHYGGDPWTRWYKRMHDQIVESQVKGDGHNSGSWNPGGGYAATGGRLYETALCLMTLEIYYRRQPIYMQQATEKPADPE